MNLIAITDEKWGIAKDGCQIIYIPDDLKRFKLLTENKTVILGRKTLSSFPDKKPLPKRKNIILTRNINFKAEGAVTAASLEEALSLADDDAFVIGGESIYKELLPFCSRAYITMVRADFKADKFIPDLGTSDQWKMTYISEEMAYLNYKYTFRLYERVQE